MKKTTTVICALLTATSVLCVSGCGKKADLVVANAGGKKITVGDLSQAGQKVAPEGERGITDPEKWRKCLDLLINEELIVLEAKLGKVIGPIEAKGGYAVFKVLKREPPRRKSLSEVKNAVTKLLRQREEERLFNELIKNLREKYDPQITIYEDILQKVTIGGTDVSAQS